MRHPLGSWGASGQRCRSITWCHPTWACARGWDVRKDVAVLLLTEGWSCASPLKEVCSCASLLTDWPGHLMKHVLFFCSWSYSLDWALSEASCRQMQGVARQCWCDSHCCPVAFSSRCCWHHMPRESQSTRCSLATGWGWLAAWGGWRRACERGSVKYNSS